VHPHLGRAAGDVEQRRDLGVRVALDLLEHEHHPQRVRQRVDRPLQREHVERVGDARSVRRVGERHLATAVARAQAVERHARRHALEPRLERPPLVVAAQRLGEPQEDVVQHVLRVRRGAGEPPGEREQRPRVARVQLAEGGGVAGPRARDQVVQGR
jgi:hypothetical protein